jgi:sigma-B regulation protein RsbU (phosphoserine phosphatase)
MGLLHGAVRSSYWAGNGAQHEEASRRLNELLCTRTSVERFASLFWCYYDPEAQVLRYVNAGHLPPLVVRCNGAGPAQLRRLEEGGPVLGVISEARYRQGEMAFLPGDLLVMYSDGVVEAADANEEEFGEKRLTSVIQHNSSRSSQEIRDEILRQVREFLGGEVPHDDLTLLVARASQEPGANSASSV